MRSKPLTLFSAAAIGLGVALATSPAADASSRFTVNNQSSETVEIMIFNGNDSECRVAAKLKTISPGETNTYRCDGIGKAKCKIVPRVNGNDICENMMNTCGKDGIKAPADSTLKITGEKDNFQCQLKQAQQSGAK